MLARLPMFPLNLAARTLQWTLGWVPVALIAAISALFCGPWSWLWVYFFVLIWLPLSALLLVGTTLHGLVSGIRQLPPHHVDTDFDYDDLKRLAAGQVIEHAIYGSIAVFPYRSEPEPYVAAFQEVLVANLFRRVGPSD